MFVITHFLSGSEQRHVSRGTTGASVARFQDGFFHSSKILPADWLQDVGGDM